MSFIRSSAMTVDRDREVDKSDIATDPWKAATASLPVVLANAAVLLCCLGTSMCLFNFSFPFNSVPSHGVWVSVVIAGWMWGRAVDILMLWSSPPLQCL